MNNSCRFSLLQVCGRAAYSEKDSCRIEDEPHLEEVTLKEGSQACEAITRPASDVYQHMLVTRVAALTGTTLSVGFVAWALRSGALLASFMATMSAWRHFDPLPVLGGSRRERERRRKDNVRDQQAEAAEFRGVKKVLDRHSPFES
ncbi:MAG: hypothetical protein OEV99_14545 [Nitrospira sp.]|nr:hypothetical protein [Nitrospira sp.]MDH4371041.1 hypothetical protein [Nitrospira sp.]MDH5724550.1 hypothetical protein [Nitrospira sp.]